MRHLARRLLPALLATRLAAQDPDALAGDVGPALPEDVQASVLEELADRVPLDAATWRIRAQGPSAALEDLRLYQRLTARAGPWELAAVAERDPGERRWNDHAVGYAHWRGAAGDLALGHLRPAFGQGLLFGRGAGIGVPAPRPRRDGGELGSRATAESYALAGVASRRRFGALRAGLVAGRFARDARLDSLGVAVSLPEDGLHDGRGAVVRDRLRGTVAGARAAVSGHWGQAGVTLQHLRFDRAVDLRRPGKVAWAFAGRAQASAEVDLVVRQRGARWFFAAARAGARTGLVAGVAGLAVAGVRVDGLARRYDAGYFSPFGAAASGAGMDDERGATLQARLPGARLWLDDERRPAPRATDPLPGRRRGAGLHWERRVAHGLRFDVDAQRRAGSLWLAGAPAAERTARVRGRLRWQPGGFEADAQLQGAAYHRRAAAGDDRRERALCASLAVQRRRPRAAWSAHVARFRGDGYGARVYEVERDLPGAVSIRPLYGDGWRLALLAGVRAGRAQLWVRARFEDRRGEVPRRGFGVQLEVGAGAVSALTLQRRVDRLTDPTATASDGQTSTRQGSG